MQEVISPIIAPAAALGKERIASAGKDDVAKMIKPGHQGGSCRSIIRPFLLDALPCSAIAEIFPEAPLSVKPIRLSSSIQPFYNYLF